ncbi:MAG: Fic family protein [Gammaproteobacteria bacterium]|nr:Fic family protein [Gammaproteobacteria bacterium]
MVSPNERLAEALTALSELQGEGRQIFQSSQFRREHRERLIRNGYLRPVIKGWLLLSRPDAPPHDTTAWHASFWEFCARYCSHRFGERWHLSAEISLRLHAEDSTVPSQLIVRAAQASNNNIALPFDTSLFDLTAPEIPVASDLCERNGIRIYTVEAALLRVTSTFYRDHPVEARTVLAGVRQVGPILQRLLDASHSTIAGRLAGAFRHIGRNAFADQIGSAMRNTEHLSFRETNPFVAADPVREPVGEAARRFESPIVHRLRVLWDMARETVLSVFPDAPGLPSGASVQRYLDGVSAAYLEDAYHSLSIEGYRVTPELIERVRSGEWNPEGIIADHEQRDALAARGYWQAFQAVHTSVKEALSGADPGRLFRNAHTEWYLQLFQPFVTAGIYEATALAGYRNRPVFLHGSRHVPPRAELLGESMETLFDLLEEEPDAAVRAVVGHWMLGYIHPYPDGNGRMARFLMNLMLASGGYPWATIRVEDRRRYMASLEEASVAQNIAPFADFTVGQLSLPRTPRRHYALGSRQQDAL